MSLRKASWSRSASPELPPSYLPPPPIGRRHNPMAISNLLHPQPHTTTYRECLNPQRWERVDQQEQRQSKQTSYSYPVTYTSYKPAVPNVQGYERFAEGRDEDDRSSGSSFSSPAPSHTSLSPTIDYPHYHFHGRHNGGSSYPDGRHDTRPSTSTSSSASPPASRFELLSPHSLDGNTTTKRQSGVRSATIYHRNYTRRQEGARPFGSVNQGRHFCTYIQYKTNAPCSSWQDGYTTWYDLARHADSEHGPEEVDLIDRGLLDFERAQWIKSEEQRAAIKSTLGSMVCQACGTSFASNRVDSIERHIRKGACERAQEKKREKSSQHAATVHKKKGGKTASQHTRR